MTLWKLWTTAKAGMQRFIIDGGCAQEDAVVIKDMARPTPPLVQIVKMLKGGEASLAECAVSLVLEAAECLPASTQLQELLARQLSSLLIRETGVNVQSLEPGPQLIAPSVAVR